MLGSLALVAGWACQRDIGNPVRAAPSQWHYVVSVKAGLDWCRTISAPAFLFFKKVFYFLGGVLPGAPSYSSAPVVFYGRAFFWILRRPPLPVLSRPFNIPYVPLSAFEQTVIAIFRVPTFTLF
jgi:hypothetical protein